MAHVKSGGATSQQQPRPGKRLGVKKYGGEKVKTGNIIIALRVWGASLVKLDAIGESKSQDKRILSFALFPPTSRRRPINKKGKPIMYKSP